MTDRRLLLGAVVMNNGSHALHGLWRLPEASRQREFERGLVELVRPDTFDDFIEFAVPVLQERGLVQRDYSPGTLREKLFGQGPFLPASHRAHHLPISDSRSAR